MSETRFENYYGILEEFQLRETGLTYVRFDCFLKSSCSHFIERDKLHWLSNTTTFSVEFEFNLKSNYNFNATKKMLDRWFELNETNDGVLAMVTETSKFIEGDISEKQRRFKTPEICDGRKSIFKTLSKILSEPLKEISTVEEVENVFNFPAKKKEPIGMCVYEVGQGNCSAVVDDLLVPTAYFDFGTAWGFNARTRPAKLQFCFTYDPPIILSHWDLDHWYAARFDRRSIGKIWIVPFQKLKPSHARFATDIKTNGKLIVCPTTFNSISLSSISSTLLKCTGSDTNNSGLAIKVETRNREDKSIFTILGTGDAEFQYIPLSNSPIDTFIAPHHGAALNARYVPKAGKYKFYAVSFGLRNTYNHPHIPTRNSYNSNGWHGPLDTINGGILLSEFLGKSISFSNPACRKKKCSLEITQT